MSPNLPNPYLVLGVSETASTAEIKKAYRKLARENHPDSNPGDKAKESRFKDISAAYEILGDADKRAQFDALKRAGPGAVPEGVFDIGDLFAQMFGGAAGAGAPGQVRYEVRNTGSQTPSGFQFPDLGSVFGDFSNHTGKNTRGSPFGQAFNQTAQQPKAKSRPAPRVHKLSDGSKARVKGLDLHSDVRIKVDQAILGARATVATKDGKASLQIPRGTSSGTRLRLRGKGLRASPDRVGDHYVTVHIDVPRNISDEAARQLVQFMEAAKKDGN